MALFVGRDRELQALEALVRRAQAERLPIAALVEGEPGAGKSRLLTELCRRVENQLRTARIAGYEPLQAVPLGAVGDLLRNLAAGSAEGAALARLVFDGDSEDDRLPLRIFEAAHRAATARGPVLIAVDDLQWLDERSVALLHYLLRAARATRRPLVIVAAARPSPIAASWREHLEAELPVQQRLLVELGPLGLADGLALLRSLDDSLAPSEAETLWRRAAGSPFWLEALARARHRGQDATAVVAERLRDLSPDAGAFLAALCVGARPFAPDELEALLGWHAGRTRQATAELVARGLVVVLGGVLQSSHDLIREAAMASLPASARRRLHARLADWIEAAGDQDVQVLRQALEHRLAAGQDPVALAVRLVASPGRHLLSRDDLRLLASLSDGLPSGDEHRVTLDQGIAELAAAAGEVELALDRWSRVAERSTDLAQRRHAEIEAAATAGRTGRVAAAREHLERARALPCRPEELVRLDAIEADVELWPAHDPTRGIATAARALAAAERLVAEAGGLDRLTLEGRRAYQAAIEVAIDAAMQGDRDDEIPNLVDLCIRVAAGLDDVSLIAAQIRAGQALRTVTRTREGEVLDRQAWDAAQRLVLPTLAIEAGRERARALRDLGRLPEARAVATETGRLEARLSDAPQHWGSAPSIGHLIELSSGDSVAALRALRRDAAAEVDPHYRQDLHLAIAVWQARTLGAAAAPEVAAELAAAQADAELARCPRHHNALLLTTAELLARIGQVSDARQALTDWDRLAVHSRSGRELWRLRAAGQIAAAEGDQATAASLQETLAARLEQRGLGLQLLWTWIDVGQALAAIDRERAIASLRWAAELAEGCGATSEGRIVARLLRRLGVRAWRRGAAAVGTGVEALSPREREIADLVGRGASNREVAEALFLSPKTVERHITNILAKTGFRNRTELASRLASVSVRDSPDE